MLLALPAHQPLRRTGRHRLGPDSLAATVNRIIDAARQTNTALDGWAREQRSGAPVPPPGYGQLVQGAGRARTKQAAWTRRFAGSAPDRSDRRGCRPSSRTRSTWCSAAGECGRRRPAPSRPPGGGIGSEPARFDHGPARHSAGRASPARKPLLIEAQYGNSVEVEPQTIMVGGRETHADILRIGRLALFWRSPDGEARRHTGSRDDGTDRTAGQAQPRDLAGHGDGSPPPRPIDLVSLPLGRISR
ncbi:MAG: DUF3450 family protein [bacterium]|nr:DUF3450 family protein [bacterium]